MKAIVLDWVGLKSREKVVKSECGGSWNWKLLDDERESRIVVVELLCFILFVLVVCCGGRCAAAVWASSL